MKNQSVPLSPALAARVQERALPGTILRRLVQLNANAWEATALRLLALPLNTNHLRGVLDLILEISRRDGLNPWQLIEGLNWGERGLELKTALTEIRYPRLTELKNKFHEKVAEFKLPPFVRVREPAFFEDSSIEVNLKIQNYDELLEALDALRKPGIKELFDLT